MTDKFKDQDSMLPAATDDKKKAIVAKTGGKTQVIINPPEKVDPQRGYQERFKSALEKHSVIIEKKTELVLQSKAGRAELPQTTLEQVFKRGYKSLPLNSQLTREQYAMNRVNSFVAGGAAMVEDCDLLPIVERVGIKGTGGGARPHIKREKSPYNGKTVFHVVDAKGQVKHSTGDEFEAKKHLATKYNSYMESTLSPMKRFEGTKSLVKTYKDDTPGEGKKDVAESSIKDVEAKIKRHDQRKADREQAGDPYVAHELHSHNVIRKQLLDKRKRAQAAYQKKMDQQDVKESATLAATVIGGTALARAAQKIKDWKAKKEQKTVKEEVKKGLYYYVNKRKKAGTSRDKDNPKAPSAQDWKNAAKTAKEEVDLEEAIKLGTKVKMHAPGKDYHDSVGSVGEIRHGAYKGAPKTYTVDYGNGKSVQLSKQNVKLHKEEISLSELSNAVLARYKQKAGEQASAADKAGNFKKGNKRFSGIMKATMKQFDNDAKGNK